MNSTTHMLGYDLTAKTIARWFIVYNHTHDRTPMTSEKLNKLLYYAQGITIKYVGKTLFRDKIESSAKGPVIPAINVEFYKYGTSLPIPNELPKLGKDVNIILQDVYEDYNKFTISELINMTCSEAPWIETPLKTTITIEKMIRYFER